jgi:glycine oxidase
MSGTSRPRGGRGPRGGHEGDRASAVVVGGGVIGLAVAWRASQAGVAVTVLDPAPGRGASYAAAGMLTPATEVTFGEERMFAVNRASADRYPAFVAELAELTGQDPGYRRCGTLSVALDDDDRVALRQVQPLQDALGFAAEWLTGRECRRLEPMLTPALRGGLLCPDDHQVDNRRLAAALLAAAERSGVRLRREPAAGLLVEADRATGVRTGSGEVVRADTVVLAAGCWSATLPGLPPEAAPPVRPVKGQILRLRVPPAYAPFVSHNLRGLIKGGGVYLVPRADGELVVGATVEEQGFDTTVTAGGVYELLRDAHELVPGLTELPLVETHAGLRPGSPDNAAMIGPTALPGLVLATGHHRNGILLTPVTADGVAELLATGTLPQLLAPCLPGRFAGKPVGAGASREGVPA